MSTPMSEVHKVSTLSALQTLIATLAEGKLSYRTTRIPSPKPGGPLFTVTVYG